MRYLTSKCPHCGYIFRNRESGVPSVQLGLPVLVCPTCNNSVFDEIQTEYDFMTDSERGRFISEKAMQKGYLGNIIFIVVGIFLLIAGISIGNEYIAVGLIGGIGCILIGVSQIMKNKRFTDNKIIETYVYESLLRTSNSSYTSFLQNKYESMGKKRKYSPVPNRNDFMIKYSIYSNKEIHDNQINKFNDVLSKLSLNIEISSVDNTVVDHH